MPSFDPFVRAEAPRPCEGADRGRQLSGIAHFGILPIPLKEMRCGGVLEFSEIRSAAGREWTDDGQVHEVRRPKGGPRNAVRRVPVPPVPLTRSAISPGNSCSRMPAPPAADEDGVSRLKDPRPTPGRADEHALGILMCDLRSGRKHQ